LCRTERDKNPKNYKVSSSN